MSAGQSYQDIITVNPDDDRGYFGMGQIHSLKKNDNLAINYFNKAIECNPLNTEAMCNIAFIYINSNDYTQANKQSIIEFSYYMSRPSISMRDSSSIEKILSISSIITNCSSFFPIPFINSVLSFVPILGGSSI